MKRYDEMTWTEKSAALLIVVGKETAAEILKHLDEQTVIKISQEMAKISSLAPEDREELLGEFVIEMKNNRLNVYGGEEVAKKILIDSVGIDKAKEIFQKVNPLDIESCFSFLKDVDDDILYNLLKDEHPQTVAVTLSFLESVQSAGVLKKLDKEIAKDVAIRIAKMKRIVPEAVEQMAINLKIKFDKLTDNILKNNDKEGVDRLADIINHLDGKTENDILNYFEKNIPEKAEEIRNKIYTFESILSITNKEVRILVDEINNDAVLAKALKGAGDDIRFKVLRNVSNNRATDILNEIEYMGAVRLSEILEARQEITNIMRELNDNGVILLRKKDDSDIIY